MNFSVPKAKFFSIFITTRLGMADCQLKIIYQFLNVIWWWYYELIWNYKQNNILKFYAGQKIVKIFLNIPNH